MTHSEHDAPGRRRAAHHTREPRPRTDLAPDDTADPARTTSPATTARTPAPRARDRYIDTLRALALIRVIAYHLLGWLWLPYAFPSMGVMFALAGSLMAVSLDRTQRGALAVVKRRLRRLLPPYWAYALAVVPLLLFLGWRTEGGGTELTPVNALAWVIPYAAPPSSTDGLNITIHLWYIGAYMWMMLASTFTLRLFRRSPLAAVALPFVVPVVVLVTKQAGNNYFDTPVTSMFAIVMLYLPCWMLGYAHRDGMIRRLPLVPALLLGAGLLGAGLVVGYVFSQPGSGIPVLGGHVDMMGVDLAAAWYSLGFVLILLRLSPDFSGMKKIRPLDSLVASMNSRAMTIYLWNSVAIAVAYRVVATVPFTAGLLTPTGEPTGGLADLVLFVTVWVVMFGIVLGVGWVEDVAARRRPQLMPKTNLD